MVTSRGADGSGVAFGGAPFSRWQDALNGVLDVGCSAEEAVRFEGEIHLHPGRRFVPMVLTASSVRLFPARHHASEAHGHVAIILVLEGEIKRRIGGDFEAVESGGLVILDLSRDFELDLATRGGRAALTILWAPRVRFYSAIGKADLLHGALLSSESSVGAVVGSALRMLAERAGSLKPAESDALADGFVELACKGLDYVLRGAAGPLVAEPIATFVSVRNFADQNLASPKLGPEMIARAFGLSRASLYRLFAPVGGVASYVREARLGQAYQQITSPRLADKRIGQIAQQLGFKNVGVFNRLFAAKFGLSPGEARARALGGLGGDLIWKGDGKGGELRRRLDQTGR